MKRNSTHHFVMKMTSDQDLQQIAFIHPLDADLKDLINLYKICTAKPYSFSVIDATIASDNVLRFRKKLSEKKYKS